MRGPGCHEGVVLSQAEAHEPDTGKPSSSDFELVDVPRDQGRRGPAHARERGAKRAFGRCGSPMHFAFGAAWRTMRPQLPCTPHVLRERYGLTFWFPIRPGATSTRRRPGAQLPMCSTTIGWMRLREKSWSPIGRAYSGMTGTLQHPRDYHVGTPMLLIADTACDWAPISREERRYMTRSEDQHFWRRHRRGRMVAPGGFAWYRGHNC